ncbi:hypothetical protein B005_4903 [Nocardiopsis alba ATCC BAA-2165]|uniref:Uncharacterized protein n=1 Tax=Nocardiopsis alba (strain ATCC BAA-2165 / BE74) TaxID=1205910 RepID=J7L427_NOCAA|nr:hypothetical protein B005_4903 [Nocardiopsis alba ATCC BAA-2165]
MGGPSSGGREEAVTCASCAAGVSSVPLASLVTVISLWGYSRP